MSEGLEAIRERLEAATDGPWKLWNGYGPCSDSRMRVSRISPDPYGEAALSASGDINGSVEDLEFVAHAPEDIAYLLEIAEAAHQLLSTPVVPEIESKYPEIREAMTRLNLALDGRTQDTSEGEAHDCPRCGSPTTSNEHGQAWCENSACLWVGYPDWAERATTVGVDGMGMRRFAGEFGQTLIGRECEGCGGVRIVTLDPPHYCRRCERERAREASRG